MLIEDGSAAALRAAQLLCEQRHAVGCPDLRIWTRDEFLEMARQLPLKDLEKRVIVDQAILLVDQFYAHLPFKRARYAVDPVQRLRLLRTQVAHVSDAEFHGGMLRALTSLRDAHTYYGLPAPYRDSFAFLPFRLQFTETENGVKRFLVTHTADGFEHPTFGTGSEILNWNGVYVNQAVERQGESDSGANPAARLLRGLSRMTYRSLTFSLPPDENWVVLQYKAKDAGPDSTDWKGILLPWTVATECHWNAAPRGAGVSLCDSAAEARSARKLLYDRDSYKLEMPRWTGVESEQPAVDLEVESLLPNLLRFQHGGGSQQPGLPDPSALTDANGRKFGYIRIVSFGLDESRPNALQEFVDEFRRIAEKMQAVAPDGLIIDIRSNPGGVIAAAERLLQFFTPHPIQPAGFHLASTNTTRHIATTVQDAVRAHKSNGGEQEWLPWVDDLMMSIANGSSLTEGRTLTLPESANLTGQCYQGHVVLVTDATTYSAADIFTAGFQDHRAGTVVGMDDNTGGGGANGFRHSDLEKQLREVPNILLEPLPSKAELGLALRRSSRVGANAGIGLEDVGARSDVRYFRTEADLLEQDRDMFTFLREYLAQRRSYSLRILSARAGARQVEMTFDALGLDRLECLIDGFPQYTITPSHRQPVRIPTVGLADEPSTIRVNGFAKVHNDVSDADELVWVVTACAPVAKKIAAAGSA